jgi:23S rRNA (cytidine2498-2'-O)-methyltransferase
VRHLREDGFRFRPRDPVDWLTCDMIAQPARVAALVADWIANGHAHRAMFNLKLPMKRRSAEIERLRGLIAARLSGAGRGFELRLKHLYHDREEVTGFCALAGRSGSRKPDPDGRAPARRGGRVGPIGRGGRRQWAR